MARRGRGRGAGDFGRPVGRRSGETWFWTWAALGRRVREQGEKSAARGRSASARDAFLRAAGYFGLALVGVESCEDPETRLREVFGEHRDCFDRFAQAWDPPAERVAIPYEGRTLPGYLVSPTDRPGPLSTVIVNNGGDGTVSSAWTLLGAPAVARGHRALLFDGPGQQSMLFDHGVTFRPDWEKVVTPVVDFLSARSDVDAGRIALAGISQAGYWVPRALAFEHRIAAAVADPGVVAVAESWWRRLGPELRGLWDSGDRDTFDRVVRDALDADPALAAMWQPAGPAVRGRLAVRPAGRGLPVRRDPGGRADHHPAADHRPGGGALLARSRAAALRRAARSEGAGLLHRGRGCPSALRADGPRVVRTACLRLAGRPPGSRTTGVIRPDGRGQPPWTRVPTAADTDRGTGTRWGGVPEA